LPNTFLLNKQNLPQNGTLFSQSRTFEILSIGNSRHGFSTLVLSHFRTFHSEKINYSKQFAIFKYLGRLAFPNDHPFRLILDSHAQIFCMVCYRVFAFGFALPHYVST